MAEFMNDLRKDGLVVFEALQTGTQIGVLALQSGELGVGVCILREGARAEAEHRFAHRWGRQDAHRWCATFGNRW